MNVDEQLLSGIVCDPDVMSGKPVIRGTRLSVDFILNLLSHGQNPDEIIAEYEGLEPTDIQACLLFASHVLADSSFVPLVADEN